MKIKAVKTRKIIPPQDDLLPEIFKKIKRLPENSIMAITSKVVSIDQGRCVLETSVPDRDSLIMKEAAYYLPRKYSPHGFVMHTIKHGLLIPSAGIDRSNSRGYYILWPKHIELVARNYHHAIKRHYQLKKFGLIIIDSHSIPLRRGVVGISLAHVGFSPLLDYRGKSDIFGRKIKVSQTNIPDALAAAATVVMGEGKEQTPLAIITDIPFVKFGRLVKSNKAYSSFTVPLKQDIYKPFLTAVRWKKGK